MKFMKVTYPNGEVWKGRFDKAEGGYCSDDIFWRSNAKTGEVKTIVRPSEWLGIDSFQNIQKDKENKIEEITKDEYWDAIKELVHSSFDEEIQEIQEELERKRKEKEEALRLVLAAKKNM